MEIKKSITFIYMDTAEYQNYFPIYKEAQKRGYEVKMSKNKFEKCEIGFYCQHVNFPQFSKLSIIMLHDITQGFGNWPNIWLNEPWDKYDVGILPGAQWTINWQQSSDYQYVYPKMGVFEIGWPKADIIGNSNFFEDGNQLFRELGLDINKKTILYAPAWENDMKQDDFVKAMLELDVNIIIKQAAVSEEKFPDMSRCIKEMHLLHKDISRVHIIDPNVNILDAIKICDVLVSEESSTMCEATLLGKVAVSVVDWLIPDTVPSRLPVSTHPFTVKTKKIDLTETVKNVLENYDEYSFASIKYRDNNFSNIGTTAVKIMDIIDSVIEKQPIPYKGILPTKKIIEIDDAAKKLMRKQELKRYLFEKYFVGNALLLSLYGQYRRIFKREK